MDGQLWHLRYPAGGRRRPHRGHHPAGDDAGRHRGGRAPRGHALRAPDRDHAYISRWRTGTSRSWPTTPWIPPFGTGAVKVTPAHDPADFEIGRRHGLAAIDIMTPDARINENAPERFRGLDRFEAARKQVVREFEALGLLEKVEPHRHAVGHCYRCDTVVEPRLSDQWFVRMAAARRARARRLSRRKAPLHSRAARDRVRAVDGGHPRLVHLAPALVGPPDSGLVLRRADLRPRERAAHRPRRPARLRRPGAPGRGRARHLVLLLAGAVLEPGLARPRRRTSRASIPATPWSPPRRSSSSGSRAWSWPDSSSWARCRSAPCTCTAPCATRSTARCPSRSATASIRSRSSSASAPTRSATP